MALIITIAVARGAPAIDLAFGYGFRAQLQIAADAALATDVSLPEEEAAFSAVPFKPMPAIGEMLVPEQLLSWCVGDDVWQDLSQVICN